MAIRIIKQKNLTWANIDKVDEEALKYLMENYNFHHLDLEDLQSEAQTPKLDVYKNYLFVVLQFPTWQLHSRTISTQEIDMFLGDEYLITIQHTKSKEMKNFFFRCMRNRKIKSDWMNKSSGYLLNRIIESLFSNSEPILNNMGRQISKLEEEVFSKEPDVKTVRELAIHRRNILNFRRIIDPQRYLISNLTHTRKPFLDESLTLYFNNINDYLSKIWSIIENYKETVDGIHVTVESLIARRTNRVVATLTAISVALLPLTLLSGIYGMNIDNLPFAHNPLYVWIMFLSLATFISVILIILRKKRLL